MLVQQDSKHVKMHRSAIKVNDFSHNYTFQKEM